MEPCDSELVAGTLAGEPLAFARLVDRYRDAVCGVAYHYLGSFDDVQDAAQEAFVQAYSRVHQLRDTSKFGPWVRSITVNTCKQVIRRRRPTLALDELDGQSASRETDEDRAAVRMMVRRALDRLSDSTRLTVTLSYINGYSQAEVADFLEVPVNTVRSRLQHAKKQLREEMLSMVTDVLSKGKPEPEFTWKVVDEAMRQAHEARGKHATGDALRHYDEALAALDKIEPSEVQLRLKMQLLAQKASASNFSPGKDAAIALVEQSLAIAVELGDLEAQANLLQVIGLDCSNAGQVVKSEESYRKALEVYRELGDPLGQGNCLMWLGSQRVYSLKPEVADGRRYYEEALPLYEAAESHEWVGVCRATLALLDEVGEERLATPMHSNACCLILKKEPGVVSSAGDVGSGRWGGSDEAPMLGIGSPFWHVSRLRKFLDDSVPVGGSWSGEAFSYSYQPLQATVTVVSKSEFVSVPAGTFENCLLTEQVTVESDLPDDPPEGKKGHNRMILCGVCRAWYAPGVGLVQLHVKIDNGPEGTMQLTEYSVQGDSDDYLPLDIGNSWVYGWPDLPSNWVAKEAYHVSACKDGMCYLPRYSYAYKEAGAVS